MKKTQKCQETYTTFMQNCFSLYDAYNHVYGLEVFLSQNTLNHVQIYTNHDLWMNCSVTKKGEEENGKMKSCENDEDFNL